MTINTKDDNRVKFIEIGDIRFSHWWDEMELDFGFTRKGVNVEWRFLNKKLISKIVQFLKRFRNEDSAEEEIPINRTTYLLLSGEYDSIGIYAISSKFKIQSGFVLYQPDEQLEPLINILERFLVQFDERSKRIPK